jgi:ABC-type nitrate/sulfonate/bicarbonate transport system substrate-binding protein
MMAVVSPEKDLIITLSLRPDVVERVGVKASDPLDRRLAALKGLTLAIAGEGSVTDTTLQLMLKQAKVSPTDIKKVNIDTHPARMAALQQRQIDGFLAGMPLDVATEMSKETVIFASATELGETRDFVFEAVYGSKRWVESHPEESRGVARAHVKANRFLLNDPGAVKLLRDTDFKSVEEAPLTESLNRMKKGIPPDGKMTKSGWEGVMNFSIAGGLLRQPIDVSEGTIWTNKYLD